jgi:hypothetical protein
MSIREATSLRGWSLRPPRPVLGLDLGSRASKGVLLVGDNLYTALVPTGLYMQETADALVRKLLRLANLKRKTIAHVVGTGYGRISLEFSDLPYSVVTEISCHAMGAHALVPEARTILDIGGQDSKAIKIDRATGKVVEFVMNDKCAAGTGRFLEKAAARYQASRSRNRGVAGQRSSPGQQPVRGLRRIRDDLLARTRRARQRRRFSRQYRRRGASVGSSARDQPPRPHRA